MILMHLVMVALGVFFLRGGFSYLESSSLTCVSDSAYPDGRAAERKMERLLGWLCVSLGVLSLGAACAFVQR